MTLTSKEQILETSIHLFAQSGFEQFSIRNLAKKVGITHSVIYHYFENEEKLLKAMFEYASSQLGIKRKNLPQEKYAIDMLKARIEFQIDNSEYIVAVLKYYLSHRPGFQKFKNGFIPDKSTLHIEEVLTYGMETGEFHVENIQDDAKVIAHAINGFLLEYYPHVPRGKEKIELIDRIYTFIIRSLKGGEKNG